MAWYKIHTIGDEEEITYRREITVDINLEAIHHYYRFPVQCVGRIFRLRLHIIRLADT